MAIVFQISIGTNTDARVARNDVSLTTMELAIESAFLEVEQQLITDATESDEAGAAGDELAAGGEDPGLAPEEGAGEDGGLGGGEASGPVDSREDEFLKPQRTEINGIQLRILIQDEDGKFNVLALADPDEEQGDIAEERLARILDLIREDTAADLSSSDAEDIARDMREFMMQRNSSDLSRPDLLTDDEDREDVGYPLSLREFGVLDSVPENAFREFRDENGDIVHSFETFLTMWSALATGIDLINARQEEDAADSPPPAPTTDEEGNTTIDNSTADGSEAAGGDSVVGSDGGGYTINLNTAPPAVLKGFFDPQLVDGSFWDQVIEYRNLEEEEEEGEGSDTEEEDDEPVYDEYGEEIIERQVFDSVEELNEIEDFESMEDERKEEILSRLRVASDVFTVYITARRSTASAGDEFTNNGGFVDTDRREDDERNAGTSLMRTVRAIYWRRGSGEEVEIVPLVRWEVVDFVPFELQDYPEDDR